MHEPLLLREASMPSTLVLIRFGRNTLAANNNLRRSCEMTFARCGLYGFSVFELPDGDYDRLGRLVPLLLDRQWVLEAAGSDLLRDGFPVLPTRDHPHWTVMLAEPTSRQVRWCPPALLRAQAQSSVGWTAPAVALGA